MSFPKGIINIIIDYSHTLFYLDELKDKTKHIYEFLPLIVDFEERFNEVVRRCYSGKFLLDSSIHTSRYDLMKRENKRKSLFNIKQETFLFSFIYSKNYKPY